MKKKKLAGLSLEHRQSLAVLANNKEFKSLESLFRIEENNIVLQSFKVNSGDPDIRTKKAHFEGRIYELRKILKTFEEAKKVGDDET